ncbi:MAG: TolC family protein [Chitinophagales bacterium]|nr:TolC family protein [Chitinophagaceae bacterium]MCB9064501.1 TolC family protein [Chitinophagales bacterium]
MLSRLMFIWFMLLSLQTHAQDSVWYLSQSELVSIVKQYHPVVKQAALMVEQSDAKVTAARGAFDPIVSTNFDRKTFGGNLYYSYLNPELKIPTWYGVDLKVGTEEVIGNRVTTETTLGQTSYAGVNVSVLNGLLFDERRTVLRQAQSVAEMTDAERRLVVNNTLFESIATYFNWVKEYNTYKIYQDVVRVNKERLKMVKLEYEQGNRPAIDTVEAKTQLQTYQLLESEAWVSFQNAGLELANYMWLENSTPTRWSDRVVPHSDVLEGSFSVSNIPSLEVLLTDALSRHPKLDAMRFKIDVLETERRLQFQSFLPKLDVGANVLNKGYDVPNDLTMPFLENNYKLGVDFYMPLLYRKARGGYKAAKLKVQETELSRDYTALQIENKVKSYYNEVLALQQQIELYQSAYDNFSTMYRGEMIRYEVGESNLFLINSRETKLLAAQQKLLELKVKWHKSYAGLLWAAGTLN